MEDSKYSAVEKLYEKYFEMIYRICFVLFSGNREDTEDAVGETFLRYIETDKDFHDSEHEKAWLIVTAQNVCNRQRVIQDRK